ncbi:MAG TPA: helix-turn-helix domain-containing protein [Aquabacterium sp.]|nr:helix-turn-helix domain-containing protein [Aquabacterium sp.]
MSDAVVMSGDAALIRRARQAKGLSLESLASTLKVTPAKLEALESGRYQDLPDLAFARALAKTVCRYLDIDSGPVMATFPSAQPPNLSASEHRGVPFKDSKARLNLDVAVGVPWKLVFKPQWLAPIAILLAAVVVYFWPAQVPWLDEWTARLQSSPVAAAPAASAVTALPADLAQLNASATEVASSEPTEPVAAQPPVPDASASLPLMPEAASAASSTAASSAVATPVTAVPVVKGALQLQATDGSWVEVRDATGAKVFFRQMAMGELVGVDGKPPLSVKIGNAGGVRLSYQGQPIELAAFTRNNVASLQLK